MVDTGRLGELIRRDVGWCLYATTTPSARKGSWKKNKIISTGDLKDDTWIHRSKNWTGDVGSDSLACTSRVRESTSMWEMT
jgi:hypothetical protein